MTAIADFANIDAALQRGDVVHPKDHAPIRAGALQIIDAVLYNRPDIASSIIVDGVAFYSASRPVKAATVAEYTTDVQSGEKRQNGAKKGKAAPTPRTRKPRASKAKKAEASP